MKKLLGLAILAVMASMVVCSSCSDDPDIRRVYVENNTADTLYLYYQDGTTRYSEKDNSFDFTFLPKKTTEMATTVKPGFSDSPSTPFDEGKVKVQLQTAKGKVVKKDYHNGNNFEYRKSGDYPGYYMVVNDTDF